MRFINKQNDFHHQHQVIQPRREYSVFYVNRQKVKLWLEWMPVR
ncbi:hypothetical protein BN133_3788 [Cronobacter dublinensis 582]|nr:hypothetical protein BN133_3788 [Cronobacter dublinensis 582]